MISTLQCVGRIKPFCKDKNVVLYCKYCITCTIYTHCAVHCVVYCISVTKILSQNLSFALFIHRNFLRNLFRNSGTLPPCWLERHCSKFWFRHHKKASGPEAVLSCQPGTILTNITSNIAFQQQKKTEQKQKKNTDCHLLLIFSRYFFTRKNETMSSVLKLSDLPSLCASYDTVKKHKSINVLN